MMPPTTSTIAAARQNLATALNTGALSGNFYYAWPGAVADKPEVGWIGNVTAWSQEIPTMKAGRKQRQETYTFEVVLLAAKPEASSDDAKACFDRAVELSAVIEDALADDPTLGNPDIQWAALDDRDGPDLAPYQRGWVCQIVMRISGNSRLT